MTTILVTVVGPAGRRDLSLPAQAPVYELLPSLVQLLAANGGNGPGNGPADPEGWRLSSVEGQTLPGPSTLSDRGVLDGAVLYLARPDTEEQPVESPATTSDDQLTPAERTAAVLPERNSVARRIGRALSALVEPVGPSTNPGGAAAPPDVHASPSPAALTVSRRPSVSDRVRSAWRETGYLEALDEAIRAPRLRRCVTIAVVSPKGGVGKTTTTALLGSLFALLRRDRVVAVDTNPDYGSLGRILTPDQQLFVDDLLAKLDQPGLSLTALDAQLGRSAHGLMVLPAPTDPARMEKLDEAAYGKVIERLKEYVGVLLLDCGTGLQEPAARAAIKGSDQLVLVTDGAPAAASLVAEAAPLLVRTGRPITLVVNRLPARGARLDLVQLGRLVPQANALVVIKDRPEGAERLATGEFDWRDAPTAWQKDVRQLAVTLVADWGRLGLEL